MRFLVTVAGVQLLPGIFFSNAAVAQEYPRKEINVDQLVQELFSQQDEDVNYEDLYESLFQRYTTPLNLNAATRDELASLYILTEHQINSFMAYRSVNGKLLSVYELQAIPGFDLPVIYKLIPFVEVRTHGSTTDNRSLWQRISTEQNHYLIIRYDQVLETKKGFTTATAGTSGTAPQRYLGSPGRLYARYRVSHSRDFSFGFTLEKDAGEQLIWEPATRRYGMDFFSFHAALQNRGRWKQILVGDYQVQAGQGLVLSAGFAVGKGAETVATIRRNSLGVRPYTSVLESGFFRGVAATYAIGRLDITGFYSNIRRDANVRQADSVDAFTQSIYASGFHRTANEIAAKGNLHEQVIGSNAVYRHPGNRLQLGGTVLFTHYDSPIRRKPTTYNQFEFSGKMNTNAAVNYSYVWQNFNFFGEAAISSSGGGGAVAGLVSSLTSRIELGMVYRHYDRHFHSFFGNAFGENTRPINERGMYWGIKLLPIRKVTLSAYYDSFRFPWLKFGVDAPSGGYEYLLRMTYKPTKTIMLYAQYREKSKEKNQADNPTPMDFLNPATRRNYLITLEYPAATILTLRSRVQLSSYRQSNAPTHGYALIQDVNADWKRWRFSTRYALFDTDDYDNRQYVYESDVLYAFSLPAYYNRGTRYYGLVQYRINQRMDLWARYARTHLRNQDTMGSGLEAIQQPHRTEIKLQVRYRL